MIRLFDVLPCYQSSAALLECWLRNVQLSEITTPRYETVSYVWGDTNLSAAVQVNGRLLKVPASAEKVLRRLVPSHGTRTLWIDAICINQADILERSQQVAMMGKIYSQAERNLVYLGEDDGTVKQALDIFDALQEEILEEMKDRMDTKEAAETLGRMITTENGDWVHASSGIRAMIAEAALLHFFSRAWFR